MFLLQRVELEREVSDQEVREKFSYNSEGNEFPEGTFVMNNDGIKTLVVIRDDMSYDEDGYPYHHQEVSVLDIEEEKFKYVVTTTELEFNIHEMFACEDLSNEQKAISLMLCARRAYCSWGRGLAYRKQAEEILGDVTREDNGLIFGDKFIVTENKFGDKLLAFASGLYILCTSSYYVQDMDNAILAYDAEEVYRIQKTLGFDTPELLIAPENEQSCRYRAGNMVPAQSVNENGSTTFIPLKSASLLMYQGHEKEAVEMFRFRTKHGQFVEEDLRSKELKDGNAYLRSGYSYDCRS